MVAKVADTRDWLKTASDGLASGAAIATDRRTTLEWDLATRCESPVYREYRGRTRPARMRPWHVIAKKVSDLYVLELHLRCRKCAPCRKAKAWMWRMRAVTELANTAGRTWFVTLTLSPEAHFRILSLCRLRLAKQGEDFDRLEPDRQFGERVREANREITLWLKRVRKEAQAPLRYILVAERHKSGLPHFHALLHEVEATSPVRAATIKGQWRLGFSQCKLVAEGENHQKSATYVCKYIAKDASSRVRASQGYGQCVSNPPCGIDQKRS